LTNGKARLAKAPRGTFWKFCSVCAKNVRETGGSCAKLRGQGAKTVKRAKTTRKKGARTADFARRIGRAFRIVKRENERFGKVFGFRFYVAGVATGKSGKVCRRGAEAPERKPAIFVKIEMFVSVKRTFQKFAPSNVNFFDGGGRQRR
jgi:hypothetical protein